MFGMWASICKGRHCRSSAGLVTKGCRCGFCESFGQGNLEYAGSDSVDVDPEFEEHHSTTGHRSNRCELRRCLRCGRDCMERGSFRARNDPLVRVTCRMCRKEDVLQTRTFVQGYCPVCFESDASNLVVLECGHTYSCAVCHTDASRNSRYGGTTSRAVMTS